MNILSYILLNNGDSRSIMMITIERMKDLFDEEYIEEMLEDCADGCCHFNAANICRLFKDWDCIDYVEGYIWIKGEYIGHAICSYTDYFGKIHYFDPTQEWKIKVKHLNQMCFTDRFDVVKTFSGEEIINIFNNDPSGMTHLVAVKIIKD